MKDFHIKRHRWLRPQDQGNEVQERFNTAYKKHLKSGQMPFKKDATLLVAVYEPLSLAYAKISISSSL